MKTALLVSTYNWPEALELVLKSISDQTQLPDLLLIADDGSTNETKELIHEYSLKLPFPVYHTWQEDKGFRKAQILNKSIADTDANYIIQIDGDCILHPKFVEDHIKNAKEGLYLYGSRVNILPEYVQDVLVKKLTSFYLFSKEIKNKTRTLHIPLFSKMYTPHSEISSKFRGCNVSFWRDDFLNVNGYNEDFEGWGREDSDLVIRMGNAGIKAKRLRYAGILYHIHHTIKSKDNLNKNDGIQQETLKNKIIHTENGVNKYLNK